MIICPNCKEEIDDDSHYCDQCGQALLYCNRCGRVGMGRRCTSCGGMMVTPEEYQKNLAAHTAYSSVGSCAVSLRQTTDGVATASTVQPSSRGAMPELTLFNGALNIRIQAINGAVIGRRQGPYAQFFQQNRYVSGVHAQLRYNSETGWAIIDKHSSNGTKLNERQLQPDIEMQLHNGDIVTIANINLQVIIK